jgi:hypothetical protein
MVEVEIFFVVLCVDVALIGSGPADTENKS